MCNFWTNSMISGVLSSRSKYWLTWPECDSLPGRLPNPPSKFIQDKTNSTALSMFIALKRPCENKKIEIMVFLETIMHIILAKLGQSVIGMWMMSDDRRPRHTVKRENIGKLINLSSPNEKNYFKVIRIFQIHVYWKFWHISCVHFIEVLFKSPHLYIPVMQGRQQHRMRIVYPPHPIYHHGNCHPPAATQIHTPQACLC